MLLKISEAIADSLAHAEEARQRALHETNEKLQAEWREIESRWRHIADSLRFVEQANQFLDDAVRHRTDDQVP